MGEIFRDTRFLLLAPFQAGLSWVAPCLFADWLLFGAAWLSPASLLEALGWEKVRPQGAAQAASLLPSVPCLLPRRLEEAAGWKVNKASWQFSPGVLTASSPWEPWFRRLL